MVSVLRRYAPAAHHCGSVERDLLGVAAGGARHRKDALSRPQIADVGAGLDDLAGGFEPR
jgi:hypothetical protein